MHSFNLGESLEVMVDVSHEIAWIVTNSILFSIFSRFSNINFQKQNTQVSTWVLHILRQKIVFLNLEQFTWSNLEFIQIYNNAFHFISFLVIWITSTVCSSSSLNCFECHGWRSVARQCLAGTHKLNEMTMTTTRHDIFHSQVSSVQLAELDWIYGKLIYNLFYFSSLWFYKSLAFLQVCKNTMTSGGLTDERKTI